jgi:hypothetical protein
VGAPDNVRTGMTTQKTVIAQSAKTVLSGRRSAMAPIAAASSMCGSSSGGSV